MTAGRYDGGAGSGSGRGLFSQGRGRRPRWMTLLTVLMLLAGGRMFFSSVTDLHRLVTGKPEVLNLDGSLDAQQEALLRGQLVLVNALSHIRPSVMLVHALARLALGLVYLFAVAAVFSRDPRGRRASLLAGWVGIVVSLGNVLFLMLLVRPALPGLLPTLVQAFTQDASRAGRAVPAASAVAEQAGLFLVDVPVVVTALGITFSLILLAYFAGPRVRMFYNQSRQVDHDRD
jgi:hypothetical protein